MTTTANIDIEDLVQTTRQKSPICFAFFFLFSCIVSVSAVLGAASVFMIADTLQKVLHNDDGEWYLDVHSYAAEHDDH